MQAFASAPARVVTGTEALVHGERLWSDPEFNPAMDELADLTDVEELEVFPSEMKRLLDQDAANADRMTDHRIAIVAKKDIHFGIARIYEQRTETNIENVRAFRATEKAMAWLGQEERA